MTPRQHLTGLVQTAVDLADEQSNDHAAYVLTSLLIALTEGREDALADRLARLEARVKTLEVAALFPGANRG